MTELRKVSSDSDISGWGIFATRRFEAGEVIFRESTPWKLRGNLDSYMNWFLPSFVGKQAAKGDADGINAQDCFSDSKTNEQSKLWCMLLSVLRFVETPAGQDSWLLDLYHPLIVPTNPQASDCRTEEERKISNLSNLLMEWLDAHADLSSSVDPNPLALALRDKRATLQKIALIWACNAFSGGRIYQRHSRLNHSCQPNAVVQTSQGLVPIVAPNPTHKVGDDDEQWIRAANTIQSGEEVTISYLPIEFLYSETSFRRSYLLDAKYFICGCSRCSNSEQVVTAIPCIKCHPRMRQGMLDEDVQYDDDQAVHYSWMVSSQQQAIGCTEYRCSSCGHIFSSDSDDDRILYTHQVVTSRIAEFLKTYQHHACITEELRATLTEYYSLSSSVNGALFWTTNVLLYYQLDTALQTYHSQLIADTSQEPDPDQVAESIDMLQRLCRFVKHSKLPLHRGHWLGDVTIGSARALITLGDRKSQKYASDWLSDDDFDTFVKYFEPEHLQMIVERLGTIWTRLDNEFDVSSNKRLKAL